MTNRDIIARILAEVSGRPEAEVAELLETMTPKGGAGHRLDEEVPDDKAHEIMTGLRAESGGILAWLLRGAAQVEAAAPKTDKPQ